MKFIHIVRNHIRKTILYLELFHHFRKIRVKNHKSQDKFDFKLYHPFPFWRCASWFAEKYKFLRFPFNNLSSIESHHLKFVHKFGDHYFRSGAMLPNLPTRTQDLFMQSIWNLLNNVLDHNTQAKFEYVYIIPELRLIDNDKWHFFVL